jgi:hypothetical protein
VLINFIPFVEYILNGFCKVLSVGTKIPVCLFVYVSPKVISEKVGFNAFTISYGINGYILVSSLLIVSFLPIDINLSLIYNAAPNKSLFFVIYKPSSSSLVSHGFIISAPIRMIS